jgi:hypothetical protein
MEHDNAARPQHSTNERRQLRVLDGGESGSTEIRRETVEMRGLVGMGRPRERGTGLRPKSDLARDPGGDPEAQEVR